MATEAIGSTASIITRTGADADAFGFDTDGEFESFVDDLREQATSEVERYCQRRFRTVEDETDRRQGNGTDTITTRNYPVLEVHSIAVDGRTLPEDAYRLETSPGMDDDNAGEIVRVDRARRWDRGCEVTIEYDWGYEDPPGVAVGVVEDLVFETLERSFTARESSGKQSESMDGYSVNWSVNDAGDHLQLTEGMQTRLDPLRRTGVA